MLTFSTFGSLQVARNGTPVYGIGGGKPAALLIYLAMKPGQHRREIIADLFWPGLEMDSARLNLRQAIFQLRNALMESAAFSFIESHRNSLGFSSSRPYHVDAIDLISDLPKCTTTECDACLTRMAELTSLYKRPFLSDFELPDCPDFSEWLQITRESLHRRVLDVLARLADCHERKNNYRAALPFALRYTELEPWSESGHMRMMRLHMLDGQYDAAIRQYEACARILGRELGVQPNTELQALAAHARRHECAPVSPPLALMAQPSEAPHRKGLLRDIFPVRIFLIDDHAMFRAGLSLVLRSAIASVQVLEAGSLEAAMQWTEDAPDILLLDIQLQGLNGLDGIAPLLHKWPQTPIVILSSDTSPETKRQALERGVANFVSKAETADNMLAIIKQVLGKETVAPSRAGTGSEGSAQPLLTPDQREILDLLCLGLSNKVIGLRLGLSENTVRGHVQAVLEALQVSSRSEAVYVARQMGLVS